METTDLAAQIRTEHKKARRAGCGGREWCRPFFTEEIQTTAHLSVKAVIF